MLRMAGPIQSENRPAGKTLGRERNTLQNAGMQRCSIEDLYTVWSTPDGSQILDVREHSEYAAEHIPGTVMAPLTALARHTQTLDRGRPTYVVCHWGNRSVQAARKLMQFGFTDVRVVEGGLLAWMAAELPVERGEIEVWSLERQVRFTAGLFAFLGALLAWLLHPAFIVLAGLVGAGLMHAAATNTCAMGLVLAKLPWNQQPAALQISEQPD